jgi:hypothetical protein
VNDALAWSGNWAWSVPLIVITVTFHVIGLVVLNEHIFDVMGYFTRRQRYFLFTFTPILAITTLCATLLHAAEASIWAAVFWFLGALPDGKSALLYSLSAMTSYGHEPFYLARHWQLMGALEALNGMILFGLTTAFLYRMIRAVLAEQPVKR